MKGCKYLIIFTLCSSNLWWSSVCDSISEIPIKSSNEESTASLSQEQILNVVDEKLNSELKRVPEDKASNSAKVNLDLLKAKEISDATVDFSQPLNNEDQGNLGQVTKQKSSHTDSSGVKIQAEAVPQDATETNAKFVEDTLKISSDETQTNKFIENSESLSVEASQSPPGEGVDHPDSQEEVKESSGSQQTSPVDVISNDEHVVSSSTVVDSNLPEQDNLPSEEMPLFDEWKKMMLAGQEEDGQNTASSGPPGKKLSSQKRRRNYASSECGAKIVASNSEAEGTSRILTELSNEYMLNPCQAKVWFVIEMCESVQASQIELANFELFSSLPKAFAVYSSNNFPTREWVPLGVFTAAEQRVLQSFPLQQEGYGKFIKIEMQSHYGNEYYCPISVVRIFGTSMVDEYEEMETLSSHPAVLLDDDFDRIVDLPVQHKSPTTIFGSATDAVYNIVKKAAQALLPHQQGEGEGSDKMDHNVSEAKQCKVKDKSCTGEKFGKLSHPKMSAADFLASVTSIHPTLFNHLRRCEQCIKTSKPSYHSISEPQCRFFQAAMGPVLFTSVCDWFRDHHLTTITRHQMPIVDTSENITGSSSKMSPPPVIRVIIETNQSDSHPLRTLKDSSVVPVHNSDEVSSKVMESSSRDKILESTTSEGLKVEPEIRPTKTVSVIVDGSQLELDSVTHSDEPLIPEAEGESSTSHNLHSVIEDLPVPELPPVATIAGTEEIISPSLTLVPTPEPSVVSNETKTGDAVDMSADEISSIPVIPSTIDSTSEDLTEVLKTADEKFVDTGVKLETVAVGGLSSQKESVFIRMNHRIKALELNMSLSSQYLQELSRRYRRQMEEMQRSFNRTVAALNETARKTAERDQKQQEAIETLQAQVVNLTIIVDQLVADRDSLMRKMLEAHLFLMVVEAIVMITIMSLCVRRVSSVTPPQSQSLTQSIMPVARRKRRNSTDSSGSRAVPKVKKRSSSEEVISPGNQLLIIEPATIVPLPKGKKRNKKKKGMHRSASNPSMSPSKELGSRKKSSKERSSAAGIIFTHASSDSRSELENLSQSCENCIKGSRRNCEEKTYSKGTKRNSSPLKNVTNEDHERYQKPTVQRICATKERERFSFRKFLKFQKRESI